MSVDREIVTAEGAPPAAGPYSHIVRSNGFLFLSGQVPIDPATGRLVEGDIAAQTKRCLENLTILCKAAGASLANAVRCGIFVTDMGTFPQVNEFYATYFETDPPARATVAVAALPLGAQVEIDAVVAV
jgi:2-iminobutanoate/2-iminopropanoate deaminase